MKKVILICISFICLSYTSLHKYYIALTEIEHNEKNKSVEMVMNVFIDDIELAVNKEYATNLNLATKFEIDNADELFYDYLSKHLKIKINDQRKTYKFIGKEYDGDILYFYLEVENIDKVASIHVTNSMLVKYFPEQQNLIKATVRKDRKSLFLTKTNDKGLLNF
ncbi:hypothetical protein SAMN04489761_0822 [Tenacibaculum sp. MAR_2009_124]|uniref:DUF6702 family protein n=1 Tax=Tenacibaculum sp. MAR_2009_124 TaxID=1250059 RepID=UPI00089675E9|nr:DUF6702 family protein [Tenacibaculum sp. MAR_2009_124]SEB45547.1 hypothetical protein SAMN04489761_0822 [Tenacibaculum sp. MAR_2009_124]